MLLDVGSYGRFDQLRVSGDVTNSGILEVGATADVTVLDRDPLTTDPEQLAEAAVLLTLVGGRMVAEPVPSSLTTASDLT